MANKSDYDVIVVGAGIGGLVCGCYLAKAGLKTLIVEKNPKAGGYCTTFIRQGFHFDIFAHSLGGCRKNGNFRKILNELGIEKELALTEASPSRVIITEGKTFEIYNDMEITLNNLSSHFPHERKGLKDFFEIIKKLDYLNLAMKLRGVTFEAFLKTYISDAKLYNLFSFLLFQSSGLPASLMSALFGLVLFRDYILDGGYYPAGGMQRFPEVLQFLFAQLGGTILFNSEVKQIILKEKASIKINLNGTGLEKINTSVIISNADPIHTLMNLFGFNEKDERLMSLMMMEPSLSCIGVNLKIRKYPLKDSCVQFMSLNKDIEKHIYRPFCDNNFENIYLDCFLNKFNDTGCVTLNLLVPFNDRIFWRKNKDIIAKKLIKEFVVKTGLLLCDVELKGIITPINSFDWTHSYKGASFGWAPTVSQVFPNFNFPFIMPNLYFVGQWLGMGHGISTVAYLGRYLAKTILDSGNVKSNDQKMCPWVSVNNYRKS